MKQVTQTLSGGEIQVAEVPTPALRAGGVLVRNAYSLISAGTERAKVELARKSLLGKAQSRPDQVMQAIRVAQDQSLMTAFRKVTNRLSSLEPLGYSCAGKVIAVGAEVEEFQVGDLVACAGSGYANHAEVVFVPKNLCAKIPDSELGQTRALGLDEAAFSTVGAIALQGVRQAEINLGVTVVVIGLGLVGLLTVQLLRCSGCRVMGVDPNGDRRELASSLGCSGVAEGPDSLLRDLRYKTGGVGADSVIVTAASHSASLIALAGEACREKGRVVIVGDVPIEVPRSPYYEKELDVRMSRSYGPGRYDPVYEEKGRDYPVAYVRWTEQRNLEAFLRLIAEDKVQVRPLVTHRFSVDRALDAYQMVLDGSISSLGVLLEYPQHSADQSEDLRILSSSPTQRPVGAGKTKQVGIALIGGGNFAQDTLLPALRSNPHFHLRGIVTQSGLRAHDLSRRFGFEYSATEIEQALQDSSVQAVVIATRHDSHADFAMRALKAGKAVYVEKPLAMNAQQLEEIVALWRSAARGESLPQLMVGFNRRFAPCTTAAKKFLAGVAEPLILTYRVNAGSLPKEHWLHDPAAGGGRIIGEGCHFVDLLMFLADSRPCEVYAQRLPNGGSYRDDNVAAQFRYADGSIATLVYSANGDKRTGKEYLEIFGGGASIVIDDFRKARMQRASRRQQLGGAWRGQDKGHQAGINAFVEAVRTGGPSPTPIEEVVMSSAATLAIVESIEAGEPITVDGARWMVLQ
jgi:predicted dehydrogenase/threonine dehydrogenase-like Zn-dependent dehydrogenase